MTAEEMFERLGYYILINDKDTLAYHKKNDYCDDYVLFHIGAFFNRTYCVDSPVDYPMNVKLHKAIHRQLEELGWLDE